MIAEQAKVCLAEFSKIQCNSLELTSECKKLLSCVQLQEQSFMTTFLKYLSALSKEIHDDYIFPTLMAGLLLLFQLNQALRVHQNFPNDD